MTRACVVDAVTIMERQMEMWMARIKLSDLSFALDNCKEEKLVRFR